MAGAGAGADSGTGTATGIGSSASLGILETDITVLKETLHSQQQLLQKLYAELDVEREASATATNEALSMILRLQGEKAAVKMEASQYKRLAEEKIGHTEESLAIFEELMYQKEMEISSLEYQIQSYKYKLLSLGCDDLDDFDKKFPNIPFSERNENGVKSTVRRLSSLPALLPTDFNQKKSASDGENNPSPVQDLCSNIDTGNFDLFQSSDSRSSVQSSVAGDFSSYWEKIKMLDEKVKEIVDSKEDSRKKISNVKVESLSQNTTTSSSPSRANLPPKCHKVISHEDSLEKDIPSCFCSSNTVHDIFEVSETSGKDKTCFNGEKSRCKSNLERDNRLKKPDLMVEDTFEATAAVDEIDWKKTSKSVDKSKADCKLPAEHETEWMNSLLLSENNEKRLCKSSHFHQTTRVADYQSELQQLNQRVEQLESERNITRHEITDQGREEELNLLKDLREQLNSIQSELRSLRPNKSSPSDEVDLLPLTEAMLYFWM